MNRYALCFNIWMLAGLSLIIAQESPLINWGTVHSIYSDTLNEDRTYWISLPNSYHSESQPEQRYPVLFILDGRRYFKPFVGAMELMSQSRNGYQKIPEMIVVAIGNIDRERDFTPDKIETRRVNRTGGGDRFLFFLEHELLPKLEENYRTIPFRMLVGHSLAGLLSIHAYMRDSSAFNAYIAIDPSLGTWDEQVMSDKIEELSQAPFQRALHLSTANWDKRNSRNRDRHVMLFESLHRTCVENFNAAYQYYEDENHSSVPLIAFYDGMSFLFKGFGYNYREATTANDLIQRYQSISDRLNFSFIPPESLVNRIGYRFLQSDDLSQQLEAIAFFKINTENYPWSTKAFYSLGEAYEQLGKIELGLSSYRMALKLDPKNLYAKKAAERLKSH